MFLAVSAQATVRINEFVSEHAGAEIWSNAPIDMDGDTPDWIEIYNPDATAVNLQGWRLSDDEAVPNMWVFPSVTVAANSYLLVYASGKNRAVAGTQLHTNFKLGTTGELILSKPDGTIVSQIGTAAVPYPSQAILSSYGWVGSVTNPAYAFLTPSTPGASNTTASAFTSFCKPPVFSIERGYYDTSFTTNLTSATPGATIVYTLNGSEPTLTNGTQITSVSPNLPAGSLTIADSTIVRARTFKTGLGASAIVTQSYIFWSRVLVQVGPLPTMGTLTTSPWGRVGNSLMSPKGEDWAVDPKITGSSAADANRFTYDHLKAVPTVSLVVPWKGMFGPSTTSTSKDGGIYVGPEANVPAEGVDRASSFEFINPTGSTTTPNAVKGFQTDGSVHIFGGTSDTRWKQYKLSMNFNPVDDVKYDVYGDSATTKQHKLILDAQSNNTWVHPDATQRTRADYMRDLVMADLQNSLGGHSFHGRPVHLFVNGMYWGMYNLHEQTDDHFDEAYLGGNSDDWDVFKHDINTLVAGSWVDPTLPITAANSTTKANYEALLDLVGNGFTAPNPSPDLTQRTAYEAVWTKLDQADFISYMILNFVAGNSDWSHHNLYASYNRADANAKWRFHSWDAEHVFETSSYSSVDYDADAAAGSNSQGSPETIHHLLMVNAEYRLTFADAIQKYMFNGGILSPSGVQAAFIKRFDQIDDAIRGESARWGDNRQTSPYTRTNFLNERNRILNTIIPGRWTNMIANFQAQNMYPLNSGPTPVATPDFVDDSTGVVQQGGPVPASFELRLTNNTLGGGGTIYYTTDGSDPRTAWTNSPGSTAQIYTAPFQLGTPKRVKTRVLNGSTWSAVNDALFLVDSEAAAAGNLIISKIQYHPKPTSAEAALGYTDTDFEFIELMNIGTKYVDLLGVNFSAGVDFTFLASSPIRLIAPGERVLIVRNLAAFEYRYGTGLPVAGVFLNSTGLSNSGEQIKLVDANKDTISDVTFTDKAPWPVRADGSGPALVLMHPKTNPNVADPANWRASVSTGSPNTDDRIIYTTWRAANFSGPEAADDAISSPDADPDFDGIDNLLEYSRGTDPKSADLTAFPAVTIEPLNPGTGLANYAVIRFRYFPAAEDAVLTAQSSTNLATWANTSLVPLGQTENSDGTLTLSYRSALPVSQDVSRFFRLKRVYQP